MEAPPVTVMPVTGGTINMMEYLLQGKLNKFLINLFEKCSATRFRNYGTGALECSSLVIFLPRYPIRGAASERGFSKKSELVVCKLKETLSFRFKKPVESEHTP